MSANDLLSRLLTSVSVALGALAAVQPPAQTEPASIVVEGTITKVGATTSELFPEPANCVVVRVDRFLHVPDELEDLAEYSHITVKVLKPGEAKVGKRARFYTSVWKIADETALGEVPEQNDPKGRLAARLAAAELVFVGKVAAIRPVPRDPNQKTTEHDPGWKDAVVTINDVLKGKLPAGQEQVTVRFASSDDVMWVDAPKFKEGQQGVWVLNKDHKRGHFIATDRADFQPHRRLADIKKLLPR